MTLSVI